MDKNERHPHKIDPKKSTQKDHPDEKRYKELEDAYSNGKFDLSSPEYRELQALRIKLGTDS